MAGSGLEEQLLPTSKLYERESSSIDFAWESSPQSGGEPPIRKVPFTLREVEGYKQCFDPVMVSLGPYHHCNERLKRMDCHKEHAAQCLASSSAGFNSSGGVSKFHNDFVTEVSRISPPLRQFYAADETINNLSDEKLISMLFWDGCFILYFVRYAVNNPRELRARLNLCDLPIILRDMFILENQIPYVVLSSLINLMPGDIADQFCKDIIRSICFFLRVEKGVPSEKITCVISPRLHEGANPGTSENPAPVHLLDILRVILIGGPNSPPSSEGGIDGFHVLSIMELKAVGIDICRSKSMHLNTIRFKKGCIYGSLSLPRMTIDERTKTWLLNLMAYEMLPRRHSWFVPEVSAYIYFLNCLIDNADDVKELRSKDILSHGLGSDKEVAKLINELTTHLVSYPKAYADISEGIKSHCEAKLKVRIAEMWSTYFRSPWALISLIAAIFLLLLTVVQTIFTIW